jgi:hypothetical protein
MKQEPPQSLPHRAPRPRGRERRIALAAVTAAILLASAAHAQAPGDASAPAAPATTATVASSAVTSISAVTTASAVAAADARTSGGVRLQWGVREGQRWRVEYSNRLRADTVVARGPNREKQGVESQLRVAYVEQVLAVRGGMPWRVRRTVESAQVVARNPRDEHEETDQPSYVGVDAEFRIDDMGALTVEKVLDGTRDAAEQLADDSFFYSVLPEREVREGETWEMHPPRLGGLLLSISASEGEAKMSFAGIDRPPGGGEVAGIDGTLRALIRFREHDQAARLDGHYTEQFDAAGGFPLERRITGELTIDFESETESGRSTVTGSGDIETSEQREALEDAPAKVPAPESPENPAPTE